MRKRTRAGVVTALATVLVGATSTAAHADYIYDYGCGAAYNDAGGVNCWVIYTQDNGGVMGQGTFTAYGEKLYAQDDAADGRGIYVGATWWAGSTKHSNGFKLTTGAGTNKTLDLNIAEGTSVTVTVCETDDGALLHCMNQTAKA